jgi:hypothetical protein
MMKFFIAFTPLVGEPLINRDSGTIEEKAELMSPSEKRVVYNVSDKEILKNSHDKKNKGKRLGADLT